MSECLFFLLHRPLKLTCMGCFCQYSELMTDPKARKVIVLENPMLPLRIKQTVAKILFEHLSVPSLSFALSPLCALLSIGRATGLVVDVGNLETCLLPVGPTAQYRKGMFADAAHADIRVKTTLFASTHQPHCFQAPFASPSRAVKTVRYIHTQSSFEHVCIAVGVGHTTVAKPDHNQSYTG